MSIITIQIGQCGNQIGEKLFETIISDCFDTTNNSNRFKPSFFNSKLNENYVNESKSRFFSEKESICVDPNTKSNDKSNNSNSSLFARAVLIDMESKVVNKLVYKNDENNSHNKINWLFRETNSYTQKKGSGNNWSYGYCVNGPKSLDKIENIIRKEVELCDRLSSFMVCMSLAGGTGSGVGSYYTEVLRDSYPRTSIINSCVWPFSTGEVILQNYNFLLTLSKLYEHSDGIIVFENDNLHQICKRLNLTDSSSRPNTASVSKRKEVTFNDLNGLIAHKLASVVQPCLSDLSRTNYLDDIVADLCPTSDYKLLSLNNVPQMSKESIEFSSYQWSGLYKHARQLLFTGGFMEEGLNWNIDSELNTNLNKSLALSLFARGLDAQTEEHNHLKENFFGVNFINKFFADNSYRSILNPIRLWKQPRVFNKYEKSLTLLSNSQTPVFKIDLLVSKAWRMFSSKAYIHQYVKYGNFEEEQLLNAFIFVEQLIKNYKKI